MCINTAGPSEGNATLHKVSSGGAALTSHDTKHEAIVLQFLLIQYPCIFTCSVNAHGYLDALRLPLSHSRQSWPRIPLHIYMNIADNVIGHAMVHFMSELLTLPAFDVAIAVATNGGKPAVATGGGKPAVVEVTPIGKGALSSRHRTFSVVKKST